MWDWSIWGALILTWIAGTAALVLLAKRTLEGWRDVKRTRRQIVRKLDEFATKAEATADRLAVAGDTAELEQSLGDLRISLARLAVLRAALDEAEEDLGRFAPVMPRK